MPEGGRWINAAPAPEIPRGREAKRENGDGREGNERMRDAGRAECRQEAERRANRTRIACAGPIGCLR